MNARDKNSGSGLDLLRAPFPDHQISTLCRSTKKDNQKGKCPKCGGWHGLPAIQLDYVGHAALTDRLLDADPSWNWEPASVGDDGYPAIDGNGGMWIKLTVCGVTRWGYGDAQGKTGGDAMKERIGDALRNAAMRFGAALDLWHKGDLHIEDDQTEAEKFASKASDKGVTPTAGAMDSFSDEEQKFIRDFAAEIADMYFNKTAPMNVIVDKLEKQHLEAEEKVAIWFLLDSKVRSAIKKFKDEAKATADEITYQA